MTGLKRVKNLLFLTSSLLSVGGLLLAFERRVHGVLLFATLLLSYPLVYYISVPEPRYRHAIEPELVVPAVFLISSLPSLLRRENILKGRSGMISGLDITAHEKRTLVLRLLRWTTTVVAVRPPRGSGVQHPMAILSDIFADNLVLL